MTVGAIEMTAESGAVAGTRFAITADGMYAARLTLRAPENGGPGAAGPAGGGPAGGGPAGGGPAAGEPGAATAGAAEHDGAWFPERWTLGGPEPYAVSLPLDQPEEPGSEVLPLADGRVLIRRRVADRHDLSLLYPIGPGTGQLPVGSIECAELTLLPPPPDGRCAYALSASPHSTTIWLVAGGAFGPERIAEVRGRCSGGAWLDRTGRMLALDRETDGVVKAVAVDLERGGETTPLLQITEDSNDRLLLADADSGLLLIRSDAAGHDRLGWGVLGSLRPVRFPDCLRPADYAVTPIAVQPGQVLMPESCAVALRIDGAAGSWVGLWRPAGKRLRHLPAPDGWLAGAGLWSADGVLRLPYATRAVPCGVARLAVPANALLAGTEPGAGSGTGSGTGSGPAPATHPAHPDWTGGESRAAPDTPAMWRPVPLQQAPLTGRGAPG
ncbi:hypothetical protein [Streptomyces sp. NPDC051569]|uniref:hypothetical protein n=1 Tax=Streptomyces sp. NPDC051569 TaxID=3365661 RepID=UPI0037B50F95